MAGSDNGPADPEEAPDREPSPPDPSPGGPGRRIRRPEWRRRRPAQLTPPTQAELDALAADRRLELMDLAKQRLHRRVNTWVLIGGVLATVGTLLISAQTLRTSQQGQVTDRYTKATEQLGSGKRDVRTAAIYALERIAKDSPRDRQTIRDVLATFVREHDPQGQGKRSAGRARHRCHRRPHRSGATAR
ncbi:hypothetical protein [Actinomadura bangladeshensis]|uniref:Uncharacterized protein n=1 Tax=Actinomadura bangladeshensis TaxID=453573 RepID=A0A4R4N9C1_9ACTN|nr:hypothetical protein [Actinomadura bangladeshensis]TDC05445.1 hypothetical protein E1284_35380 [Actinomadura bangladeshensis]